jgi:O-antigen/teichoic acid export membrane protein
VQYSCTTKLATVLSNHPQLIMQAATPALSEMRAASQRDRLVEASLALTLAMLTVSGLVACLILALNTAFVAWWVGPAQYGGYALTALAAVHLVVRHLNVTFIYGLFCFGRERRISITNLVDGLVTIAAALVLLPLAGPSGAVLGSLGAVMVVSLPSNLAALARETATTPVEWLRKLLPWLSRFVALAAASALVPVVWSPAGIVSLVLSGLAVTAVYALVMMQGLSNGPLGAFVRPRLAALLPTTWRPRLSERI